MVAETAPGITAYVAFGSNIGDRLARIEAACRSLREARGIDALRLSTIRETDPVGTPEHPAPGGPYLNAVAEVRTRLGPVDLVALCLKIERDLGRTRGAPNAPRSIDLDVLIHGETVLRHLALDETPEVIVPHPRMLERGFVLEPLAELAPELVHPTSGKTIAAHWRELTRRTAGSRDDVYTDGSHTDDSHR